MTQVLDIIKGALKTIRVISVSGAIPLQDGDKAEGLRQLNQMMAEESVQNRSFGYTAVSNAESKLTVPDWAEGYIECKLAIRLAEYYGKDVTRTLLDRYDAAERTILEMLTGDLSLETHYPENMPVGAGAEGCSGASIYNLDGSSGAFFGNERQNDLLDGTGELLTDGEGMILEDDE